MSVTFISLEPVVTSFVLTELAVVPEETKDELLSALGFLVVVTRSLANLSDLDVVDGLLVLDTLRAVEFFRVAD